MQTNRGFLGLIGLLITVAIIAVVMVSMLKEINGTKTIKDETGKPAIDSSGQEVTYPGAIQSAKDARAQIELQSKAAAQQ